MPQFLQKTNNNENKSNDSKHLFTVSNTESINLLGDDLKIYKRMHFFLQLQKIHQSSIWKIMHKKKTTINIFLNELHQLSEKVRYWLFY